MGALAVTFQVNKGLGLHAICAALPAINATAKALNARRVMGCGMLVGLRPSFQIVNVVADVAPMTAKARSFAFLPHFFQSPP